MFKKFFQAISHRKIITGIVILALIIGGYFGYKTLKGKTNETRYVLATVEKGTLITSVTGTGQVSPANQIDIKPQVTGDIIDIGLKNGDAVSQGEVIAKLDTKDAIKAVSDAQLNLDTAKLDLEKLTSTTSLSTNKDYLDAFNTLQSAFLNLTTSVNGIDDILHYSAYIWGDNGKAIEALGGTATDYRRDAEQKYAALRQKYDKNTEDYQTLTRDSSISSLESVLQETYNTIKLSTEAIKSTKVLVDYVNEKTDPDNRTAAMAKDQTSLETYTTQANSDLSDLLTAQKTIQDSQIDVQSQQLTLQLKENALKSAEQDLPKYNIIAPFDGVIAVVNSKKGDPATTATIMATLISKEMIAEVTLNEVDMAKVQLGQKVTLTFDAIPDLTISGKVVEMDTLGTVTSGVVTYNVKIAFDTQDQRIKPNMSVSATIITEAKQNVLLVPNAAVKTSNNNTNYVEMLEPTVIANQEVGAGNAGIVSLIPPHEQQIEVGLANDTSTEVTNGLKEGDQVIVQTISSTTQNTQSQNQTQTRGFFQMQGGGRPRD